MPNRRTNRKRARRHSKSINSKPVSSDVVKLIKKLNNNNCSIALKKFLVYSLEKQVYGLECTNEFVLFSLSSYFILKNYYDAFSETFNYPPRHILEEQCLEDLKFFPGVQDNILELLNVKTDFECSHFKKCTLLLDETSLNPEITYNGDYDGLIGFEDNGKVKSDLKAKFVINFWLQCVGGHWISPLAYYFSHGSCTSITLREYLFEAILKLAGVGLEVVCVVTKMRTNLYKLSQLLNISPTNQTFTVGKQEVVFLFDVPQLMNISRNNLMKYKLKFDEMQTSWKDIEAFFAEESQSGSEKITKLSVSHVKPNKHQRLNPTLAIELLSSSVASEMKSYISLGKISESATGTAEYLDMFDKIFDIMNSSVEISLNEYCNAYKGTKHQIKFMQKSINFFKNLKVYDSLDCDRTDDIKFINGWLISINAVMKLWDILKKENVSFLLTRNLNCESLDKIMWLLRWQIVCFNNPTANYFLEMYKTVFISSYFCEPSNINVNKFDINNFAIKVCHRIPPVKHDLLTGEYKETLQKVSNKAKSHSTKKEPSEQPSVSKKETSSPVVDNFRFGELMKSMLDLF